MWPFKSSTTKTPENPTWLVEAEALEAEATRVEDIALDAFKKVSVQSDHVKPFLSKAAGMRMKAVALRIYRGEKPKEQQTCCQSDQCSPSPVSDLLSALRRGESISPKDIFTRLHSGNVKATTGAGVMDPASKAKKNTKKKK